MRPISFASAAFRWRAVSRISAAIVYGTCRRNRTVDPASGNRPHRTSETPKRALSPATRISVACRISVPPAIAAPSTAAISGLVNRNPLSSGLITPALKPPALPWRKLSPGCIRVIAFKSAPAQNAPPAPVMIATRISAFAFTSSQVLDMISIISVDSALRASGRFNVIVSTCPRRSTIACACSLIYISPTSEYWVQGSPLPEEVWNPPWVPHSRKVISPSPLLRRQLVQAFDGRQVVLDHTVHDFFHRPNLVHAPDNLPDRVEPQHVALLPVAPSARRRRCRHDILHRHRQRLGRIRFFPRLRPTIAQHPRRLAGERSRSHRVRAGCAKVRLALRRGRFRLLHRQPDRSRPHSLRAHRERRRDLPARADTAGREHRNRRDRIDHLRPQHHATDFAAVPAALMALRDQNIDARFFLRERMLGRAAQRRHQSARIMYPLDHVRRRRAERIGDEFHLRMPQRYIYLRCGRRRRPSK